jgi:hypothetical protein
MSELSSVADLVQAQKAIRALKERLQEVTQEHGRWAITFDVQVQPAPVTGQGEQRFNLIIQAKRGQSGKVLVLTDQELTAGLADPVTLSNALADELLTALLRDVAREALAAKLVPTLASVKQLKGVA